MRFRTLLILPMAAASWAVSVSAQATTLGQRPSLSRQPSFHIPGFNSSSVSALRINRPAPQGIDVAHKSKPVVFLGTHLSTCPMPVAHTDSAKEDPMPVVRGGTPEPMPVARSGCWNPLNPSH
jgi:hypothetical protein